MNLTYEQLLYMIGKQAVLIDCLQTQLKEARSSGPFNDNTPQSDKEATTQAAEVH